MARFLEPAPDTRKDTLTTDEVVRIALAALTTGGGLFGLLQAVALHAGTTFPSPIDAALAASVLTLLVETHRRLAHGAEPPRPYHRHTPRRPR